MRYVATIGERTVTIDLAENGEVRHVTVDGRELDASWRPVGGAAMRAAPGGQAGHYSLLLGVRSFDVYVRAIEEAEAGPREAAEQAFEVEIAGLPYAVRLRDERQQRLASLAGAVREHGEARVVAPMPGLVSAILAEVGQRVERGQTVVVLEAMKMENDLGAPRAGVVLAIRAGKGQTVTQGQVLAVIGDPEGAARPPAEDEGEDLAGEA
jgi:biotin carboxyl carrier protein